MAKSFTVVAEHVDGTKFVHPVSSEKRAWKIFATYFELSAIVGVRVEESKDDQLLEEAA